MSDIETEIKNALSGDKEKAIHVARNALANCSAIAYNYQLMDNPELREKAMQAIEDIANDALVRLA